MHFIWTLVVLLTVTFLAATAILQPGIFGTLALFVLAAVILLIVIAFALAMKLRIDQRALRSYALGQAWRTAV